MHAADFRQLLLSGSSALAASEARLCALDSVLGDGDHGVTMAKIARSIAEGVRAADPDLDFRTLLSGLAGRIMDVSGGAASPLWATLFQGMAGALAPGVRELDPKSLRAMLAGALEALRQISAAQVGDKTLLDALVPAVEAAGRAAGDTAAVLAAAAAAARAGAEGTAQYVARFGRAKYAKERCLGQLDPGAVSLSLWLEGMEAALQTLH